jgi:hypothetical protein
MPGGLLCKDGMAFPQATHIWRATYFHNTSFTISLRFNGSLPAGNQTYTYKNHHYAAR